MAVQDSRVTDYKTLDSPPSSGLPHPGPEGPPPSGNTPWLASGLSLKERVDSPPAKSIIPDRWVTHDFI